MSWKRTLPPPPPAAVAFGHSAAGYGIAEPPTKAARSLYGFGSSEDCGDDDGLSSGVLSSRLYCGFAGAVGVMGPPGAVGEHGVVQGVRAGFPGQGVSGLAGAVAATAGVTPPPPPRHSHAGNWASASALATAAAVASAAAVAPGPLLGPVGAWAAHLPPDLPEADDMGEYAGDGVFEAEIERIVSIGPGDFRRILGLSSEDASDAKVIQTRYKNIMRIIHPDKRRPQEEIQAGGKQICDEAVLLVQQALAAARRSVVASSLVPEDPEAVWKRENQQRMRKQQEIAASQARAAQMRGMAIERAEQQKYKAQVGQLAQSIDKQLLIESLQGMLADDGAAVEVESKQKDATTAQIMALLAKKTGGERFEPPSDVVDLT